MDLDFITRRGRSRTEDGRKERAMGQIANQMFLEWCQRTAQKIGDKQKSRKAKKQKPGDTGKKDRR